MKWLVGLWLAAIAASADASGAEPACPPNGVQLQVLGSAGADLIAGRAGSSYLIWLDGRARLLIDAGPGAVLRLAQTGAQVEDLDAIVLTHTHLDHTGDLPALVQAVMQSPRTRPLPVYGPTGNRFAPSTVTLVRTLFDNTRGAWRHLGDVLSPITRGFKLTPHELRVKPKPLGARRDDREAMMHVALNDIALTAAPVVHGVYPALAWRVQLGGKRLVFTGDMNGEGPALPPLAAGADLLLASHAVAEGTDKVERFLHMPPSVIGRLAQSAGVRQLVLAHRTRRTLGREPDSHEQIRRHYAGPVSFADDLSCYAP